VPAAPPPKLTYRGGPLLSAVEVFAFYVGPAWSVGVYADMSRDLDAFFFTIVASELIDQLSEYSVAGYAIAHGRFLGSHVLADVVPGPGVTDLWIRSQLEAGLAGDASLPPPTEKRLYFIFLPPGVSVVSAGTRSCQSFCGYHDAIDGRVFYAAVPFPNCTGCQGGLEPFDALTATSSHELCEAITDPVPGTGWYDDVHGEIGDIGPWQTRKLGKHTVQLQWSNRVKACR
jgi:hypothetical protein